MSEQLPPTRPGQGKDDAGAPRRPTPGRNDASIPRGSASGRFNAGTGRRATFSGDAPADGPGIPPVRPRRRRRRQALARRLFLAFAVVCIILSGALGLYAHRILSHFGGADGRGASVKELVRPPFEGKQQLFLLVLGVDEKDRLRKTDQRRSDTMILARVDLENKRVAALSLPRDTRVRIPGRQGHDKLNAAHTFGGPQLVCETVEALLGVEVDRYVKTDVGGFRAIVNEIGPIEMDVEKRMDYDDNWGNLHIHLKPGKQLLDGEGAMGYVRFRHDASGDLGRMKRQQKFLRAVAKKMFALGNLPRLPQVVEKSLGYVQTDMSAREVVTVANLFRDMPVSQVATGTLPGTPRLMGGVSYLVSDERQAAQVMQKLFSGSKPVARASLEVLNGNGLPGIAGYAARRLAAAGFHVSRTGNAANYEVEKTAVSASAGQEADARRAAAALGFPELGVETLPDTAPKAPGAPRAEPLVRVVLGRDYRP